MSELRSSPSEPVSHWRGWVVLAVVAVIGLLLSLAIGAGGLSDSSMLSTFLRLRAGRAATSFVAGAALGLAGVLTQGLFRNPLASPSVLGTTAGASLGGVVALVVGATWLPATSLTWLPRDLLLPVGCLVGALVALLVLLAVTRRNVGPVALLLTGFILSSLFLSAGSLLLSVAQDTWQLGRAVVAFTLGGVDGKGVRHVALALPFLVGGLVAAVGWRRHLDLLLSGDDEARSLGVRVEVVRGWVIVWIASLTAAAVSAGGSVSFVGLVVPHAMRPYFGHGHARLIPASLVGGGAFLMWADVIARAIPTRGELPLGVVTGFIGAPVFLALLLRDSKREVLA
ncbi:MAG: iron ABC transporter permease [Planctomycetota bacterium]